MMIPELLHDDWDWAQHVCYQWASYDGFVWEPQHNGYQWAHNSNYGWDL